MKKTLEPYQLIERSIIKKYRKELCPAAVVQSAKVPAIS